MLSEVSSYFHHTILSEVNVWVVIKLLRRVLHLLDEVHSSSETSCLEASNQLSILIEFP